MQQSMARSPINGVEIPIPSPCTDSRLRNASQMTSMVQKYVGKLQIAKACRWGTDLAVTGGSYDNTLLSPYDPGVLRQQAVENLPSAFPRVAFDNNGSNLTDLSRTYQNPSRQIPMDAVNSYKAVIPLERRHHYWVCITESMTNQIGSERRGI